MSNPQQEQQPKMETLISSIHINDANLRHIADTGIINGTLLTEIKGVMLDWQKEHSYSEREKWVSVNERLPEIQERVLVWVDDLSYGDNVQVDKIRKSDSYGNEINSFRYKSITHRMPLPAPPKQ